MNGRTTTTFLQDLRYAARTFRKGPGFALRAGRTDPMDALRNE